MSSSVVSVDLAELNKYLICKVCGGTVCSSINHLLPCSFDYNSPSADYFIEASTITECLHTFCKICLLKCMEVKNSCPECKVMFFFFLFIVLFFFLSILFYIVIPSALIINLS